MAECKACGNNSLTWVLIQGKWKLFDGSAQHNCPFQKWLSGRSRRYKSIDVAIRAWRASESYWGKEARKEFEFLKNISHEDTIRDNSPLCQGGGNLALYWFFNERDVKGDLFDRKEHANFPAWAVSLLRTEEKFEFELDDSLYSNDDRCANIPCEEGVPPSYRVCTINTHLPLYRHPIVESFAFLYARKSKETDEELSADLNKRFGVRST